MGEVGSGEGQWEVLECCRSRFLAYVKESGSSFKHAPELRGRELAINLLKRGNPEEESCGISVELAGLGISQEEDATWLYRIASPDVLNESDEGGVLIVASRMDMHGYWGFRNFERDMMTLDEVWTGNRDVGKLVSSECLGRREERFRIMILSKTSRPI